MEKLKKERLIELATLFPFNFTKEMELFKEVPRKSPEYVKTQIKSMFKTMGLDADDLPIQGVETTKLINALDLPRHYHKRLMIQAKKEYFAEIAETLQNRPQDIPQVQEKEPVQATYPSVSDFSWLQEPKSDGFYNTWITETIGNNQPVSEKQVDAFFETLEASIPAPSAAATKKKTRPSNVAEPPSKKKKMAVASPPPPLMSKQDMAEQSQDAESWFNSIPAPPPKSDCAVSYGSLAEFLNIHPSSSSGDIVNDSINYDTLFE